MKYKTWKYKFEHKRKYRRAYREYTKLLERYCHEYEKHFLELYGDIPTSPKDVWKIIKKAKKL